jgi:hypothetical protein
MATGWPMKVTYANGDVYSASDVNDTNGTINLLGSSVAYTAGKNKIINADCRFNQRNFTSTTTTGTYGLDRFWLQRGAGGTVTYSAQTFTAGTAPVAGYEAINFARIVTASQSAVGDYAILRQSIEDVRTFANQTVTVSAWLKAGTAGNKASFGLAQNFGSGGSSEVYTAGANHTLTTSWVRYSTTFTVASIAGKTIGTSSALIADIWTSAGSSFAPAYSNVGNQNATIDMWGLQVEQGSTATAFQTATGSIGGELLLCQRYFEVMANGAEMSTLEQFGTLQCYSTLNCFGSIPYKVTKRVSPTGTISSASHFQVRTANATQVTLTSLTTSSSANTTRIFNLNGVTTGLSAGAATIIECINASGLITVSAEL